MTKSFVHAIACVSLIGAACEKTETRRSVGVGGGTTSKCRDGAVNVSFGSGSPTEVWLEAALP